MENMKILKHKRIYDKVSLKRT